MIKKILIIINCLILLTMNFSVASAADLSDNLILNGNFESETLGTLSSVDVTQTLVFDPLNSENKVAQLENPSGGGYSSFNININRNTVYIGKGDFLRKSGGETYVKITDKGYGSQTLIQPVAAKLSTTKWETIEILHKTGWSTSLTFEFQTFIKGSVMYADNIYFAPLKLIAKILSDDKAEIGETTTFKIDVTNQLGSYTGVTETYAPTVRWYLKNTHDGVLLNENSGVLTVEEDAEPTFITVCADVVSPLGGVSSITVEKEIALKKTVDYVEEAEYFQKTIGKNSGFETNDFSYYSGNFQKTNLMAASGNYCAKVSETLMSYLDVEPYNTYVMTQKIYVPKTVNGATAKIELKSGAETDTVEFISNESVYLKGGEWTEVSAIFTTSQTWTNEQKSYIGSVVSGVDAYYTDEFYISPIHYNVDIVGEDYIKIPDADALYSYDTEVIEYTGNLFDYLNDNKSVRWFLDSNYEGITLNGNILNVSSIAKPGKIGLKAVVLPSFAGGDYMIAEKEIHLGYLDNEKIFESIDFEMNEDFSLKVSAEISDGDYELIFARYEKGILKDVRTANEENTSSFENVKNDCTVKVFLFDSFSTMIPLAYSKEYSIKILLEENSLENAKMNVRKIIKEATNKTEVFVMLKAGEYEGFERSFTSLDSGNDNVKITYMGYGGKVSLKGSVELVNSNFKKVSEKAKANLPENAQDEVLEYDLSKSNLTVADYQLMNYYGYYSHRGYEDIGIPYRSVCGELFVDGETMTVSRYPNSGYLYINELISDGNGIDGFCFRYEDERAQNWAKAEYAKLYGFWHSDYGDASVDLGEIDTENKTIKSVQPSVLGVRVRTNNNGGRYIVYNLLEELDAPGEYFIDPDANILYFYPPENFGENSVVSISVRGTDFISAENIENITFKNFSFSESRFPAFYLNNCINVIFELCDIFSLNSIAGTIVSGKNNGIRNCNIYDTDGGIVLQGGNHKTLEPTGNYIKNCEIYNFSRNNRTYNPAVKIQSIGCIVANNKIYNAPHCAIWGVAPFLDNIVEYNEIFNVVSDTQDAGAIYMGNNWHSRGNVFRYNYIHDIGNGGNSIVGIYFDDIFSGGFAYGNIIENIVNGYGVLLGGGAENTIKNNIFINCSEASVIGDIRGSNYSKEALNKYFEKYNSVPSRSNIWQGKYPELYRMKNISDVWIAKDNVIVNNAILNGIPIKLESEIIENGKFINNESFTMEFSDIKEIMQDKIKEIIPEFEIIDVFNIGISSK